VTRAEGNAGATPFVFTVTLSPPSDGNVTVFLHDPGRQRPCTRWTTAGPRDADLRQGEATKTITVMVVGDRVREPSEDFYVRLTGGRKLTTLSGRERGVILNDD